MALQIEICPDADALARRGVEHVARQAGAAIADHGWFTFAVSGGHTLRAMFAHLVAEPIAWEDVTILPGRQAGRARRRPRSQPHTSARGARPRPRSGRCPKRPTSSARRASTPVARESFDLVHLGLGPDGHTASLVPGDSVLGISDRDVALIGTCQAGAG